MYTLGELARYVEGTVAGDSKIKITRVRPFESAGKGDITLATSGRLLREVRKTRASAVIVPNGVEAGDLPLLLSNHPKLAFARILTLFTDRPFQASGISEKAVVGSDCRIAEAVAISPLVTLGDECVIEDQVTIREGSVVGDRCIIGESSIIYPNVTIYPETRIGKRVILHSGTVIGADGFGYVSDGPRQIKMPQIGSVIIQDDVEIGANSCVDRATFGFTVIERGVKLDNHVHIGHNCRIGENTIIVGSVGISGSVEVGKNCLFAGQSGTVDHVKIGDNSTIMAKTAVTKDVPPGSRISGIHGRDHRQQLKTEAILKKLPEIYKTWKKLKKKTHPDE